MSTGPGHVRDILSDVARPSPTPVVVLDFDGTVCLGDGPVLAYGAEAFGLLPAAERAVAQDRLHRFLSGDPELVRRYADGYGCVRDQAVEFVTPAQLSAAYLSSRRKLATDGLGTYPAPGVAELLITIGCAATKLVLTNAPAVGVAETLERFGLSGLLDQVVVGAHKPTRMGEHVQVLTSGRAPATLISVGDHWANDLAIPLRSGCATAYVNPGPPADEPAHVHGKDIAELAPAITAWLQDPVAFLEEHRIDPHRDPR